MVLHNQYTFLSVRWGYFSPENIWLASFHSPTGPNLNTPVKKWRGYTRFENQIIPESYRTFTQMAADLARMIAYVGGWLCSASN